MHVELAAESVKIRDNVFTIDDCTYKWFQNGNKGNYAYEKVHVLILLSEYE